MQTHKMDSILFACVLKVFFLAINRQIKVNYQYTNKLYQELKIVKNLEKSGLGS